ncbi:MAG: DegT/DnrJ/EryC1/StrS family aminotransferase, partial [candidate division WOR-3 bacterium]
MTLRTPLYDLGIRDDCLKKQLDEDLSIIAQTGRFVLGPKLEQFEKQFAEFLGISHVIGVNSGTDALWLSLLALSIGPGDEVITPAFTFIATAAAIIRTGAQPVFVDIDPNTLCLSPNTCAGAITKRTRAIVAVHTYGHCGDLKAIAELCQKYGLVLIEDACQAVGGKWQGRSLGTIGTLAAFSFYPTKNLRALGDGGAIATDDANIAGLLRQLRSHGRDERGLHRHLGWNSHLSELSAAFLLHQLPGLALATERRAALADRYIQQLPDNVRIVRGHPECSPAWHQFAILTQRRDELRSALTAAGIE